MVGELLWVFRAFLPSITSFYTALLKHCGRDKSLERPLDVLELWLQKQRHSLFMSVQFHGDHKTSHKVDVYMATLSSGDITRFKTVVPELYNVFLHSPME